MNGSFEDVKLACFGDRPVAHITYGEAPTGDRLLMLLSAIRAINVNGPKSDAHVHALRAQGFRPLLQVVYDFRFPCDIPAELLLSQVRGSANVPKSRSSFYCWLLEKDVYTMALAHFLQGLPAKRVSQRSEDGVDYAFTVKPGQRLATLTTVHEALPSVMVA